MTLHVSAPEQTPDWPHATSWWTTPYGRWRLAAESAAMRRFPGFVSCVSDEGFLCWRGWLESALTPGSRYLVRVLYPANFPDEPPLVLIDEPELDSESPHLLGGKRPCLYRPDGPRYGYDPARTTAATFVAWAALWIHAYEAWQLTGTWPGAES